MLKKNRLFTPGPTPLLPAAQTAMASYGAHHRTAEFRALFTRVLTDVKEFIGTQNDVLVLTSSGTGFMEASVSNLTSPGDKVLVLTAGKFGERWASLAKAFGCVVETVTAPYGETFSLDDSARKLTPDIRCVYVQATESSTGARHDVAGNCEAGARIARHIARRRCDHRTRHDAARRGRLGHRRHHRRLAESADDSSGPGLWRRQRARLAAHGDDEVSALLLRSAQGKKVGGQGRDCIHSRNVAFCRTRRGARLCAPDGRRKSGGRTRRADRQRGNVRGDDARRSQALGLKLFAPSSPAAALTAVAAPAGADSTAICKRFREQFGAVVANGQAEMKGQLFRIAHIGYYDYLDTVGVLAALEQVMARTHGTES